MLDSAELDGRAPLFIDAFYDHKRPVAHHFEHEIIRGRSPRKGCSPMGTRDSMVL